MGFHRELPRARLFPPGAGGGVPDLERPRRRLPSRSRRVRRRPPPPPQPAPTATASTANTDVPQKSESKWQETKRVRPPLME